MVLSLPGFIYLLNLSLMDQAGFDQVSALLLSVPAKVIALLLGWALLYHLLAGIRFLFLDFDVGLERGMVRKTAWLVHGLTAIITLFIAGQLF